MRNTTKGLTVLLILSAVGCTAAATQQRQPVADADGTAVAQNSASPVPQPTPQIVYVTPAPTTAPVVETPTEEPAPDGTVIDDPVIDPLLDWMEYLDHTITYADKGEGIAGNLADALDRADIGAAIRWSRADARNQNRHINWLVAHKPAACYRSVWNLDLAAAKKYSNADLSRIDWLRDFPYGSNATYRESMRDMKAGTRLLNRATDAMDGACS